MIVISAKQYKVISFSVTCYEEKGKKNDLNYHEVSYGKLPKHIF